MLNFIVTATIWTLALYGLIEIIKNILYIFNNANLKSEGLYLIIATKNQENTIENFMRTILFRILYGKEDVINNIIVADLDSSDKTFEILKKLENDYDCITVKQWKECKDLMDKINSYDEKI